MLQAPSSAFAQISPFFSYNVMEMAVSLDSLSDKAYVAFRKLQDRAYLKGGSLPDDDTLLARMVRMTPAVFRKAKAEFLSVCGELVAVANGAIIFLKAASEVAFRIQKSSKASAAAQARWGANPLKNNNQGHADAYANGEDSQCPNPNSNLKKESDSCAKQAPHDPVKGWKIPDTEEVLRATAEPSSPVSEAASSSTPPPESRARPTRKSPDGYQPELEALWKAAPGMARKRGSKPECAKVWAKMTASERADAMAGVALWPDNEYAMAVDRWLKRKQWIGLLEAKAAERPSSRSYSMA